ncbi:MAG: hypothetical protein Q4C67_00230 [Deinococcus sp.]|nr:hypothetical protein [Deinococcus sp.]
MTFDYGAAIRERISAEVAQHGDVPPPWAAYPTFGPHSMGWRMGDGEVYSAAWSAWADSLDWDEAQRLAYLRRYPAAPEWHGSAARFLYGFSVFADEAEVRGYIERAAALGLWLAEDADSGTPAST